MVNSVGLKCGRSGEPNATFALLKRKAERGKNTRCPLNNGWRKRRQGVSPLGCWPCDGVWARCQLALPNACVDGLLNDFAQWLKNKLSFVHVLVRYHEVGLVHL